MADPERQMKVTAQEMEEARIPLAYRDFCAHLLIPLNKCRQVRLACAAPSASHAALTARRPHPSPPRSARSGCRGSASTSATTTRRASTKSTSMRVLRCVCVPPHAPHPRSLRSRTVRRAHLHLLLRARSYKRRQALYNEQKK